MSVGGSRCSAAAALLIMAGAGWVALAALGFVGTHFLLSHPFRGYERLALGEKLFLAVYSLVAGVTLGGVPRDHERRRYDAWTGLEPAFPIERPPEGAWSLATIGHRHRPEVVYL